MIPPKAIKKITNDAHREIVVGHLLAYGFFPSTSEGIDQAKKFVAGLDKWIAPSELPNYYNDLESDLMTGRETAGIRNIKMILEQFYFGAGTGQEQPEEIPVEVEVVEVEQKEPDEPIVVKIEAPFENPNSPNRPKRIRLPRRRNVIYVNRQQKKSAADRMADAFDARLDELVDSIQNPAAPEPPKTRKVKEILSPKRSRNVKLKADFDTDTPGKPFANLSKYIGTKIKNSFKRAATARRLEKESGADPTSRFHYLKKSLGFEFGGDKLNRIKGTFSKAPDPVNDPSLTRDQRFLAGIQPDITPPKIKQGQLFDTNKYVTHTGVSKVINDGLDRLKDSFSNVEKKFADVINLKSRKADNLKAFQSMKATIDGLKSALIENNRTQKNINDVKSDQLSLQLESLDDQQAKQEEADLEQTTKTSGFADVINSKKKGDEEDDTEDDDDGGGGPLDWLLGGLDLLDLIPDGKGGRGGSRVPGAAGARGAQRGAQAARGGGILSRAGGVLNKGKGIVGSLASKIPGRGLLGAAAKSPVGKFAGRLLPGANIAIGGALAASRLAEGDYMGAALAAGSMIPGPIGWGFLAGELLGEGAKMLAGKNQAAYKERNDPANVMSGLGFSSGGPKAVMPSDGSIPQIVQRDVPWYEKFNPFKMSEGGTVKLAEGGSVPAMIGEAGSEMLIRNGQGMGGMNPLQGLAPMIVATREVTKRAGTWADPIESYVRKVTDPIAKKINLPVTPIQTDIGQGSPPKIKEEDGWLSKITDFLFRGGGSSGDSKKGGGENDPGGDPDSDAGAYKELLDMIAGVESTSSGGYEAFNTGGSAGGHVAHGSGDSSKVPIAGTTKPLTKRTVAEVMRLQAAGHLHATGRYQIIQQTLSGLMKGSYGETGVKPDDLYNAVTQDKLGIALIKGRLRTGATVSNFRNEWIGLHHVKDDKLQAAINNANSAYKANPNATATGSTKKKGKGGIRAVGDSLAEGVASASPNVADNATVGHSPAQVEATLKATVNKSNTSHVILSTGLSNNPSDLASVKDQMAYLKQQGVPFTVLPVSDKISKANGNLNAKLSSMAAQNGGTYAGSVQGFKTNDNIHPSDYTEVLRKLRLAT